MNTFTFDVKDIEIIINALSYVHWNDSDLTQEERNYIDGLCQSLEESYTE